jgi:hypothetical protein
MERLKGLDGTVASICHIYSGLNFLVNANLICCYCIKIVNLLSMKVSEVIYLEIKSVEVIRRAD